MSSWDEEPLRNPYHKTDPEKAMAFEEGYVTALSNLGHTALLYGLGPNNGHKQVAMDHAEDAIRAAQRIGPQAHSAAEAVFKIASEMPSDPAGSFQEHEEYIKDELANLQPNTIKR